jgi:hypothetical protein
VIGNVLLGLVALVVGYLILNALTARFSKVGRLAVRLRNTRDDSIRKGLTEELVAMSRVKSMAGDAALVHLARLCLGDENQEIKEMAAKVLEEAEDRALFPLIGSLDSPGRYRACMLLERLADPRALPKLKAVASRANEHPNVRHVAIRAIQMIQAVHGR